MTRRSIRFIGAAAASLGAIVSAAVASPSPVAAERLFSFLCGPNSARCEDVEHGASSYLSLIPGLPPVQVGLLGLLYFSVLAIWLVAIGAPSWRARYWHLVPSWLAVLSGLCSIYLIATMAIQRSFCGRCALAHLLNAVTIAAVFALWPRRDEGDVEPISGSLLDDLRLPAARPTIGMVVAVIALCFAVAGLETIAVRHAAAMIYAKGLESVIKRFTDDPVVVEALYREELVHEVPILPDDPVVGESSAARTVVIFSDYRCRACRNFEKVFESALLPRAGRDLRVVFKSRPIFGDAGDPKTAKPPSPSWLSSWASQAAWRSGNRDAFWRLHSALFGAMGALDTTRVIAMARSAGLDSGEFARLLRDPDVVGNVAENVRLAEQFGWTFTPVVLLDGRQVVYWENAAFWGRELNFKASSSPSPGARPLGR